MKIGIIGAGACGLICGAYLTLNSKIEYKIFERNSKAGSKILASGNGRCNLSNMFISNKMYHNNDHFTYDNKAWTNFLAEHDFLITSDNEGRCYPFSNSSKSVVDFLLSHQRPNSIIYDTEITKITKKNGKLILNNEEFDKIILASGSIASIIDKKQKGVYDYLDSLNLKLTELKPSLVGFKLKNAIKEISGVRVPVLAKVMVDNKIYHQEKGEMIFKDDGISGIAIMNMSFYYNHLKNAKIAIEMYPDLCGDKLLRYLDKQDKLKYLINPKLWDYLKSKNNHEIYSFLKEFQPEIVKTYDFKDSQVISGGIDLKQVDSHFNLVNNSNIYVGGEVLDVDGLCGGFNLAFAFNSGISIAKKIIKDSL